MFVDDDGMYVIKGRLDPEVGALLMRSIEAAGDALFREDAAREDSIPEAATGEPTKPEQRRADAMGLLAERALAAGFGGTDQVSGSRAERYQVLLHVDEDTLSADREPGRSELEDGTRLSAESARRMACDSARVRIGHADDGSILSVGRKTRTVPPSLRRALEARDRGCRFPGCGLRFTDTHHVKHWADGGETSVRNLLLLCRKHHRAVHEGGVRVCLNHQGTVVFFAPNGNAMRGTPPRPRTVAAADVSRCEDRGALALQPWPKRPLDEQAREMLPWHRKGAGRYADADLPLEILDRAREAL